MLRIFPGILSVFLVGFAVSWLIRCTPRTQSVSIPVDTTNSFSFSGTNQLPDEWWTAFGDQQLNKLVDSVLYSNLNLESAWQRLRIARAVIDRESASLFPTLDASSQAEIGQFQQEFEQFQGTERLRFSLGSNYEVDLWGRIRSSIQAERYRAQATYEDYRTTAISLSAELVRTWFQLIEAHNQIELIERQVTTNETVLNLIRNRFGSGQIRSVDILRQQQLLESTRQQLINAEAWAEVLEHRLAVLLGRSPVMEIEVDVGQLPELPPLPDTGIPSELIRRRPDVKSAFNRLLAADKDLAAAISSKYPRLNLSASISTATSDFSNLINLNNWGYSIAGNLLAPLLYGGRLRAEVDRNEAVKQQLLYDYGQVVLNSFREVEDALISEQKQVENINSLEDQIELARQTTQQLRIQYFNGMSNYLDVLTALDQEQQLQRDLLSANLLLLDYRIDLYRALAGGFETPNENIN